MKNTLSTVLCIALTAVLIVGAVLLGAVRGWGGERDKALHTLTQDAELASALQNRAMDAANLAVVAARHLPADNGDVAALRRAYAAASKDNATAQELAQADAALTQAAMNLAKTLPSLDSVQASARDQVYISTLTRTLSETTDAGAAYAAAVEDYNARLTRSLSGRIAMLLGVGTLGLE